MARTMTPDEVRAFLSEGTRTGKLAVVRRDGSPMVVPVWFVLDHDGALVFNTGADTVKGRALARDPRASVCVDDEAPPFAFVRVDGEVELIDDLAQVREWATRIGGRYMGSDRAEEFGARNGVEGELLVRLIPRRVVAQAGVSD